MLNLTLMSLLVLCVVAFLRPKYMLFCCVFMGFMQDPARKLIAGEPTFMVVLVGAVFAAGTAGFIAQKGFRSIMEIQMWTPRFKIPVMLFMILIVFQSIYSYLNYNNIIIVGVGVMSYLAPMVAIAISYFAVSNEKDFRSVIIVYCLFSIALAATVYISFNGNQHILLKEVGSGLLIYDQGTILKAHAGFMRSSEIAGWHMGAAASFLLIMSFSSEKRSTWLWSVVLIVLLLIAIGMTGRRKMIMQFFLFAALYGGFYMYFRKSISVKVMLAACAVLFTIWGTSHFIFPSLSTTELDLYYARGLSVFGDADERFRELGLGSIKWAIDRVGLFGGGVGIAAQGTGSMGINVAGGAGEGGMGRIVVELGVPGILLVLWLLIETIKFFAKALGFVSIEDSSEARFAIGVAAFIAANIPTYIVASQVYGDLYILIFLGFLAGFIFSLPKVIFIQQEKTRKEQEMHALI